MAEFPENKPQGLITLRMGFRHPPAPRSPPPFFRCFCRFVDRFAPYTFSSAHGEVGATDRGTFVVLEAHLELFEQLLRYHDPALAVHMEESSISADAYATTWWVGGPWGVRRRLVLCFPCCCLAGYLPLVVKVRRLRYIVRCGHEVECDGQGTKEERLGGRLG